MYIYLREREYYENCYDNATIDICRHHEQICIDAFYEAKKNLKPLTGKDKDKDPEQELLKVFNVCRYFRVEWTAGERWEKRDIEIAEMMGRDRAKDQQISEAKLTTEPSCTPVAEQVFASLINP